MLNVCLCTSTRNFKKHLCEYGAKDSQMALHRSNGADRPNNNLLRRLNAGDFALIAPHLVRDQAEANTSLYNPGDDVDTVHFPCAGSVVSYLVPNEDGRDVEAILVGREGAVG